MLLLRTALRRDRLLVGGWTAALALTCYASAAVTPTLYRTAAEQEAASRAINASPAVVVLYGPILDVHSPGELAMTKLTVLYAVFAAVLVLLVVRRHGRGDEESGRAELYGATLVGRRATLIVPVVEGALVSVLLGPLAALADIAGGLPVGGALLFGASWTGIGLVATGVTAVACQVSASGRACAGLAGTALGGMFLLRAVGDTGSPRLSWLSWASPFGWSTQLRAWSQPRWWVLACYVAVSVLLLAAAWLLQGRRDLGAGLVAERRGRPRGSARLASALALEWRLHRGMLVAWALGTVVLGSLMGAVVPSIGSLMKAASARAMLQGIGGVGAVEDTLIAAEMSVAGVLVTCFAVAVVGHGAADEREARLEAVLATPTRRLAAPAAVASVALTGCALLALLAGAAMAAGLGGRWDAVVAAAAVQLPAVWLVTAVAVLAWSWGSRFAVLGWVVLAVTLMLGPVAETLRLPRWIAGSSPYAHVPTVPAGPMIWSALVLMTVAAGAVLSAAAWRGAQRDIG